MVGAKDGVNARAVVRMLVSSGDGKFGCLTSRSEIETREREREVLLRESRMICRISITEIESYPAPSGGKIMAQERLSIHKSLNGLYLSLSPCGCLLSCVVYFSVLARCV